MAPVDYLRQNSHHAKMIVAHVRAGCKGLFPFTETSTGKITPNTSSQDEDLMNFVEIVGKDIKGLGKLLFHAIHR